MKQLRFTSEFSPVVDIGRHIHDGDTVVWGQGCAEPTALTAALVHPRVGLDSVRCFVGVPTPATAVTVNTIGRFVAHSYCGTGSNAALYAAGRLHIHPLHYSRLPDLVSVGNLSADTVLVQVSAANGAGEHSMGLADDYLSAALDTARVVIAEVNDHVPFTFGARTLRMDDVSAAVRSVRPPATMPAPDRTEQTEAVARRVANLIPDGATLQVGIGTVPEAVLRQLTEHRHLGLHSGILTDSVMELMSAGIIDNSVKSEDRGRSVTGLISGSEELFAFTNRNPDIHLRSARYTHDGDVLAGCTRLVAINSAIEVDLTGQVNAEAVSGRYVGAVGGAVDFVRGATRSAGGLPIIALPSTSHGKSRIVARLSGPVSTSRAEDLLIVTEHGVADLRSASLTERMQRILGIADPVHRAELENAAAEIGSESSHRTINRDPRRCESSQTSWGPARFEP